MLPAGNSRKMETGKRRLWIVTLSFILARIFGHKDAVICHLSWNIFLGFHTLAFYVHNHVMLAFKILNLEKGCLPGLQDPEG